MWRILLLITIIILAIIVYRYINGVISKNNVSSDGVSGDGVRSDSVSADKRSLIPIWSANIEKETNDNEYWRKVLTTSKNLQVVAMNTPPGESLGWEVHSDNDQFFRVESGECELSVAPYCNGAATAPVQKIKMTDGWSAVVPSGLCHNVANTGKRPLRMYTIYGPPHHRPGTIDKTHADEIAREAAM